MCSISLATENDTAELSQLLASLFEQEADFAANPEVQSRGLRMIIRHPEMGHVLKLEVDGKIVGMINLLFSISTALGGKVGVIEDFIIDSTVRGQGFGQKLFQEATEKAKEEGCLRLSLITDHDNMVGQHFYKQQGLEASSMVPFRKLL